MYKIYATRTCHWCSAAKALLEQRKLPYEVKYIDSDPNLVQEYKELFPGKTSVPQIVLNEGDGFHTVIGGHDDLVRYLVAH